MLYTPFKQRKYLLVAPTMANIFHELLHMQFFFFLTMQFLHRFVKIDLLFHTFMSKYTYPTNVRNFDVI